MNEPDVGPNLKLATFEELLNELGNRCRNILVAYCVKNMKPPEDYELNWYKSGPIWEMPPLVTYLGKQVEMRHNEAFQNPPEAEPC